MTIGFQLLFLAIGIVFLTRGASLFVDKASHIGHAYKLSPVLVGAFIVGIGTSLPEFVVSLLSVVQGYPIMAVANVMGSNIFNMSFIVGLAGIMGSVKLQKHVALFDVPISILPIGVLVIGILSRVVFTWYIGVFLLMVYLLYTMISSSHRLHLNPIPHPVVSPVGWKEWGLLVLGLIQVLGGGQLTLYFVEKLFLDSGLSQVFVGSLILAVGTSLPELITTIIAFYKKESSIAIGNILGSNVFNMLGILGASIFAFPLNMASLLHEAVWLIVISLTFWFVARFGNKYQISKREGVILLGLYMMYLVSITWFAR